MGALWLGAALLGARALAAEDYYSGKKIFIVSASSAGGGYDQYARLLARHIGKRVPGTPTIIVQNMGGAAGLIGTKYLGEVAPKDGLALATVDQATPVQQAVGDPTIKFDTAKFNFIGNPVVDNNVVVTWHASGVKTIKDLVELAKRNPQSVSFGSGEASD